MTSPHMQELTENRKNEYTVKYLEGDKVKTIDSCKVLVIDSSGVTVEEMKRLGKNRVYFIAMLKMISLRSEIF